MSQNVNFYVSLKVIIKNKKGEILCLKIADRYSMAGFYDMPGGRISEDEIQEPYSKIIQRELEEEIGKKVKYKLCLKPVSVARHIYFSKSLQREAYIFMIFFEARYISGDIIISSEHKRYRWIKLNRNNIKKLFVRGLLEGMENYLVLNS